MPEQPKRVLHIDNDVEIRDHLAATVHEEMKRRTRQFIVVMEAASCVQEALVRLKPPLSLDGIVVDLMLPDTQRDLEELQTAERRRRDLVRQRYEETLGGAHWSAEREAEIDEQDRVIKTHVGLEAGLELVDQVREGLGVEKMSLPVLFLTARGDPAIRAKCEALVEARYCKVFYKPTEAGTVAQALIGMLEEGLPA